MQIYFSYSVKVFIEIGTLRYICTMFTCANTCKFTTCCHGHNMLSRSQEIFLFTHCWQFEGILNKFLTKICILCLLRISFCRYTIDVMCVQTDVLGFCGCNVYWHHQYWWLGCIGGGHVVNYLVKVENQWWTRRVRALGWAAGWIHHRLIY